MASRFFVETEPTDQCALAFRCQGVERGSTPGECPLTPLDRRSVWRHHHPGCIVGSRKWRDLRCASAVECFDPERCNLFAPVPGNTYGCCTHRFFFALSERE